MEIGDIYIYVIVINRSEVYSGVIRTEARGWQPEGQGCYNSTIDRVHGL